MSYKKILTIQDISCVGQCSLTVALPVISACGIETCVLPSAVLSTHTAGFKGYTFKDLTEDMPKINEHWAKENIKFDAIYTGYLGSTKQIDYVKDIFKSALKDCGKTISTLSASSLTASIYESDSISIVKVITSPPLPQPKHLKNCPY